MTEKGKYSMTLDTRKTGRKYPPSFSSRLRTAKPILLLEAPLYAIIGYNISRFVVMGSVFKFEFGGAPTKLARKSAAKVIIN